MEYKKIFIAVGLTAAAAMSVIIGYGAFGSRLEDTLPVIKPLSVEFADGAGCTEESQTEASNLWENRLDSGTDNAVNTTESETCAEIVFPLDINTATAEELKQIKGIGTVTAQNIISYRDSYGYFYSYDELLNVKGIGKKKLENLKDFIFISEAFAEDIKTAETAVPKSKTETEETTVTAVRETEKITAADEPPVDYDVDEYFEADNELIEERYENEKYETSVRFTETFSETVSFTETEYYPEFPLELNSATVKDLTYIKGIGETLAYRIVEYGRLHGFYEVEDLMNVSGIGESKLRVIAPYVYADSSGLPPKPDTESALSETLPSDTETEYCPEFPLELNSATVKDLTYIKGIGETLAYRIVEHGRLYGFYEVEDLMNVSGIRESKLRDIAPYVYADSSGLPPKNDTEATEPPVYRININTADKADFMQLPGIDEALAENIIKLREEIGGFLAVEELVFADGMTTEKLAEIWDYVYI